MDAELTSLETRLAALLEAHQSLRIENHELTTRVASLQVENRRLSEKVTVVTERVEKILAQLPLEDGV
ncbi:MAG: hypothetical protein H6R19_24 [Proteobacteria bacterium]|nr:hypothetical protein [Pseudomonadota bacterium]